MAEQREWKNGKPGKQKGQKLKSLLVIQYILKHADADFLSASACLLFVWFDVAAVKHKFIGKPLKIQIFHTKNTPVHWGDFDPIKQEYSLVRRKKFIGMKTRFYTYQSHLHCISYAKRRILENSGDCRASVRTGSQ